MRARRLTYTAPFQALTEEFSLPEMGENSVLVQTLNSGISRGTEALVYGGNVPLSEHSRMACPHQVGTFTFPVTYGYACTGKVIKTGAAVSSVNPGDLVFVLHPHQTHLVVHEDWVVPLPDGTDPQRAVLCANLETALNATWDAELGPHERSLVFGAGVVGLLTAYMIGQTTNTKPVIVDINRGRKPVAERLGITFMHPDDLGEREFDCLFNTTASAAGLQSAIDHAAFEGRIIEMSWYGSKEVSLSLGRSFHSRRLTIISSQVGHVARSHRGTTSHRDRMRLAMSHLSDANLDVLLAPKVPFDDLLHHLDRIFAPGADVLCPLVSYIPTET